MTHTVINVTPTATAICATCGNHFVPPVLPGEGKGDATTCPTCAKASITERDRTRIDAYAAAYEAERQAVLAALIGEEGTDEEAAQ